jgi:hypothetical protein
MSKHRREPRNPVEQMLGRAAFAQNDGDRLAETLAAAKPRPLTQETQGERDAVQAFRSAQAVSRAPGVAHRRLARAATVKVTMAAAVLAGGGVALASANGIGPQLFGGFGNQPGSGPSTTSATKPTQSNYPAGATPGAPATSPGPDTSPASALIVGLCAAYQGMSATGQSHALATSQYAPLVAAAGGRSDVKEYCSTVLRSASPNAGSAGADSGNGGGSAPAKPKPPRPQPSHPVTTHRPHPSR